MIHVRFEGGEELARTLNTLSKRLSNRIVKDALLAAGEPMRASVARQAPVKPGAPDLAKNISIAPRNARGADVSVGIGPTKKSFFYDLFQEFGTVNHGAQPFYRPAFDEHVPTVLGKLGQALWTELAGRGISRPTVDSPSAPSGPGSLV